ncbi:MAG: methionyl-tRNA formyltransferase, partial [Thiothrix sp.]
TALLHTLDLLCAGQLRPEPQDAALATYAHKLSKSEARIDWTQPAVQIDRTIRAFDAYPVAFTLYEGQPLRLFASCVVEGSGIPGQVIAASKQGIDVTTAEGAVRILSLQLPGGKRLTAEQFLNGRSLLGVQFE